MKYFLKIFGCQMNQSDAERISALLKKYKFKSAASIDEADLIVFVTCGVRQSAEDRVYGQIYNLRKKHPKRIIVLTGCLAHRKDVQKRLGKKVDLYFRINEINKLEKKIKTEFFSVRKKIQADKNQNYRLLITNYLKINPQYKSKYTAYVPIMTGCNNFCSYCVVPYARGREYSRPTEDILKEIKSLVKKNYKEIILLGQNVNSYKSKLNYSKLFQNSKSKIQKSDTINFAKLLKIIESSIPGKYWLSFLTSHPKDMSDELIETIAKSKKICEYISLPAQSGDNEIIRRMNRRYTIEHYKDLIKKIRSAYKKHQPNSAPAISTDIIVGFPGETKKQFENTARLLREVKYDMAYIAQYSPRPETAAWRLKDNVSKKEKERREKILTKILEKTALENNKKYIGKTIEVLVDKILRQSLRKSESLALGKYKYAGHARTQKKVVFSSTNKISIGDFARVKITKAKAFGLEGEIL